MLGFGYGRNPFPIAQPRFAGNGRRGFYENQFESGKGNQRRKFEQLKNEQFQGEYMKRLGRSPRWGDMGMGMGIGMGMGMGMGMFGGGHLGGARHGHGLHRAPMLGHGRRTLFPRRYPQRHSHSGFGSLMPRHSSTYPLTSRYPHTSTYPSSRYRSPFSTRLYPYSGRHHHRRGGYYGSIDDDDDDDDDDPFEDDDDWGDCEPGDSYDSECDTRDDRGYYSDSYTHRYPYSGNYNYRRDYDDYDDERSCSMGSQYYNSGMGSGMGSAIGSGYGYGCSRPFPPSGYPSRSGYSGYSGYSSV